MLATHIIAVERFFQHAPLRTPNFAPQNLHPLRKPYMQPKKPVYKLNQQNNAVLETRHRKAITANLQFCSLQSCCAKLSPQNCHCKIAVLEARNCNWRHVTAVLEARNCKTITANLQSCSLLFCCANLSPLKCHCKTAVLETRHRKIITANLQSGSLQLTVQICHHKNSTENIAANLPLQNCSPGDTSPQNYHHKLAVLQFAVLLCKFVTTKMPLKISLQNCHCKIAVLETCHRQPGARAQPSSFDPPVWVRAPFAC